MKDSLLLRLVDTPEAAAPEAVDILSSVPGIATVVRDARHRVLRCNAAYAVNAGRDCRALSGTTHRDLQPGAAAEERIELMRMVIEEHRARDFLQFWNGRAWLCRVIPLDPIAYGTRGTLSVIMQAPIENTLAEAPPCHVLDTADFGALDALTRAEKRTIFDLAMGRSNHEIATRQERSVRTIECHVRAIHQKLGTSSRSAIIRDASERGIQLFTESQWDEMIGANRATKNRCGTPFPDASSRIIEPKS